MLHLLMLMLLLSDADTSTCPSDLNPLTLVPPIVMAKLGDELQNLNCTSSLDYHYGMHWTDGIEESAIVEEDIFVTWAVQLSEYNVTAKCIIQLNQTLACSKDLQIVFYSENPTSLTVRSPAAYDDHVAEGTELELQCVNTLHPVRNMTMTWYKGDTRIRTDHFPEPTANGSTSLLRVNVSREDDGAEFRCETWLDPGSLLPDPLLYNSTFHLSVHYAPHPFGFHFNDYQWVEKGHNVTVSCNAGGKPSPQFHWTRGEEMIMEDTRNLTVTQVNTSALYTCVATNHLGNITQNFHVIVRQDVSGAPTAAMTPETQHPTPKTMSDCSVMLTPAKVVMRFGDRLSVNCSTSATAVERIYWEAPGNISETSSYAVWTVEELQDWRVRPTCKVVQREGPGCSAEPTVIFYKTPDSVSLSMADGPMVEGVAQKIQCNISNVAPVQNLSLSCYWGEEKVVSRKFSDSRVTILTHLTVTPKRSYNGKNLTCNAELHLGPNGPSPVPMMTSATLMMPTVHYLPEFKEGNNSQEVTAGGNLTMACSAEGNPAPEVRWIYTAAAENLQETTGGRQRNMTVTGATSTNAGVYACVATNIVGSVSKFVTLSVIASRGQPRSRRRVYTIWWLLILCILSLIFITVVVLCKRRGKHGQYSFLPASREASGIPMTTTCAEDKAQDAC